MAWFVLRHRQPMQEVTAVSERKIEGVNVRETGSKQWQFDYTPSDMEVLYRRGEWHNWQEEIDWLQRFGEQDRKLTPGETVAMAEDLRSVQESGAAFTPNPDQAFQMAHKFRTDNNRRFAETHVEAVVRAHAQRK